MRPDLDMQSIRGNVDTRINKVEKGEYDAIVLAAAGLRRLGWGDIISETFRPDIMCPAVGQGALAIETLEEGAGLDACAPLDDPWTHFRSPPNAPCWPNWAAAARCPSAPLARSKTPNFSSPARVFSPDGGTMIRYTATGECTRPAELGRNVAQVLLKRGARPASSKRIAPLTEMRTTA